MAYGLFGSGNIPSVFGTSGLSPYTAAELAKKTLRTPAAAAASNTFTTPSPFTASQAPGAPTESGTLTIAAR